MLFQTNRAENSAENSVDFASKIYDVKPIQSAWNFLVEFYSQKSFKPAVILLYSALALTLWKYIPPAPPFADSETGANLLAVNFAGSDAETVRPLDGSLQFGVLQFLWNARKLWGAFLLMGVCPALIVKFVFKEKLADYGLRLGSLKRTLVTFLSFTPIFVVMGWLSGETKSFYDVYPFNPLAGASYGALVAHSIMYLALYYLAWEFMFRGFLQLGLADSCGPVPAVTIQVLASTMLHYGHPISETLGCVAGGLLWGFFVYRTRSIFSGWGQHALLGILLDWSLIFKAC